MEDVSAHTHRRIPQGSRKGTHSEAAAQLQDASVASLTSSSSSASSSSFMSVTSTGRLEEESSSISISLTMFTAGRRRLWARSGVGPEMTTSSTHAGTRRRFGIHGVRKILKIISSVSTLVTDPVGDAHIHTVVSPHLPRLSVFLLGIRPLRIHRHRAPSCPGRQVLEVSYQPTGSTRHRKVGPMTRDEKKKRLPTKSTARKYSIVR